VLCRSSTSFSADFVDRHLPFYMRLVHALAADRTIFPEMNDFGADVRFTFQVVIVVKLWGEAVPVMVVESAIRFRQRDRRLADRG